MRMHMLGAHELDIHMVFLYAIVMGKQWSAFIIEYCTEHTAEMSSFQRERVLKSEWYCSIEGD